MTVIKANVKCPKCNHTQTEEVRPGDKVGWFCDKCDSPWESTPEITREYLITKMNLPAWVHRKGAIYM